MIRLSPVLLLGCSFSFLLWSLPAAAKTVYMVAIGNNYGHPQDEPLFYAERDAQSFASVLTHLGEVRPENSVVLNGDSAANVRRALLSTNTRIRQNQDQTSLLVYYSGHADAAGLHLGDTTLPYQELKDIVSASAATVRVLIIDSCSSGGLTRVKGARASEPFLDDSDGGGFVVDMEDKLEIEGLAIITSSTANEESHESDHLRGSFFSHHLLTGLRGAADFDQDARVTLNEVYAYAYQETLRSSGRTKSLQHPTYNYDIKGKGEYVLSHLKDKRQRSAQMLIQKTGYYLFMQDSETGPLVAELTVVKENTQILLPPGNYFVQKRSPDHYLEYEISAKPGQRLALNRQPSRRVDYSRLVRKGGGERVAVHGAYLLAGARGLVLKGFEPVAPSLGLGYRLDLSWASVGMRARLLATRSTEQYQQVKAQHYELALGVTAQRYFDLPWLTVGFAVLLEPTLMRQYFETRGEAGPRTSMTFAFGLLALLERELFWGFSLYLEAGPMAYLMREAVVEAGVQVDTQISTPVTWWAGGGVGWQY